MRQRSHGFEPSYGIPVHAIPSVVQAERVFVVQPLHDVLPTACWCDTWFVKVPYADVRRGLTRSCGRHVCVGPNGEDDVGDLCKHLGPVHDKGWAGHRSDWKEKSS